MEKRIKKYEKFIKEASSHPTPELRAYHDQMVKNFQHERLIHLIITFFFIFLTLVFIAVSAWALAINVLNIPLYIITALLFVLSIAYVKHYYFLENHIQALYDITTKLYEK